MKIMPEAQQKEIAVALKVYASGGHKYHQKSGLCYFWRHHQAFNFHKIYSSYDFFEMFPIGMNSGSSYIDGTKGASAKRIEFAERLYGLLMHPGIYIVSSKKGDSLKANGDVFGAKNAQEKFFRWVRKNT